MARCENGANFDPTLGQEIVGKHIRLRRLTPADAPKVFNLIEHNDACSSVIGDRTIKRHPTISAVKESMVDQPSNRIRFGINKRFGEMIGIIGLEIDKENSKHAKIDSCLGQNNYHSKDMTMAVKLLTAYAFIDLGIEELNAYVRQDNQLSQSILEQAGYRSVENKSHNDIIFTHYQRVLTPPICPN